MRLEEQVLDFLDANETKFVDLAKAIWERPELGVLEIFASRLIADQLEEAGFSVEMGTGQMPTAFVASWGEGEPIIGILGEYDALPSISQKVSPVHDPIEEGGAGHGCGHNLLGVGALGAVLAAKEVMEKENIPGTLRYYGCPAEETLVGKVYMARDGVFDDLDAALTWHPGYTNSLWASIATAMNSFKVNFHGVAAHAGGSPELGRSALDGVQLMDVGVNYMREHVPQDARIHCVITEGGQAPNVVPPYAQVWYYVRAPNREQVDSIYAWMLDIAQGAALMTGTTYDVEFLTGCYNTLSNDVIGDMLMERLKEVGAPQFTDEERAFARKLQESFPPGSIESSLEHYKMTREEIGDPLCDKIIEPYDKGKVEGGSTDVGDVSYITPTAQITTCCGVLGAPGHSWQAVAVSGSSIGMKGMMVAAKALALATLDLQTKPDLLAAARKEFEKSTADDKYKSPLPEGSVPQPAN
ncbi:MAG: amidohydrolase [Chloroflexi bacterium]|nr:amidohydrolase [Chloroflexota bacterium]